MSKQNKQEQWKEDFKHFYLEAIKERKRGIPRVNGYEYPTVYNALEHFIESLLEQERQKVREEEEKRIKNIMDAEFHRIQFVGYPYSGIQTKDLMELKRAFFDKSKKGDSIRKVLFNVSKMQMRNLSQPKKENK